MLDCMRGRTRWEVVWWGLSAISVLVVPSQLPSQLPYSCSQSLSPKRIRTPRSPYPGIPISGGRLRMNWERGSHEEAAAAASSSSSVLRSPRRCCFSEYGNAAHRPAMACGQVAVAPLCARWEGPPLIWQVAIAPLCVSAPNPRMQRPLGSLSGHLDCGILTVGS